LTNFCYNIISKKIKTKENPFLVANISPTEKRGLELKQYNVFKCNLYMKISRENSWQNTMYIPYKVLCSWCRSCCKKRIAVWSQTSNRLFLRGASRTCATSCARYVNMCRSRAWNARRETYIRIYNLLYA